MGIPYSKEIHTAFDQVTPLVASGFEVLQTTRNISILLAAIQVLTVILLGLILCTLFALLVTVNPDLASERRALVTPGLKWVCNNWRTLWVGGWVVLIGCLVGGSAGLYFTSTNAFKKSAGEVAKGEKTDEDELVTGKEEL